MIDCPKCKAAAVDGDRCRDCGADLRLPHALEAIGRLLFNQALERVARGDLWGAEDRLCAACALMPARVEARRSLGKVRARLGNYSAALAHLELAHQMDPSDKGTQQALAAVRSRLRQESRMDVMRALLVALLCAASALALWVGLRP